MRLTLQERVFNSRVTVRVTVIRFIRSIIALTSKCFSQTLCEVGRLFTDLKGTRTLFLAHLWGAHAIPVASSVVRRVSSVSTITTRNN